MTIEHMEFFLLPRRLPLLSLYLLPSGCRLSLRDVSFLRQGSFQKLKSLFQEMQVWLVAVRIRIMWTYHLGKGCLSNSICLKYSYLASQHRPLLQTDVLGGQEQCTSCLSPQCLLQAWSLIITYTISGLSKRHLSSCYSLGTSLRWRNAGTKEKKQLPHQDDEENMKTHIHAPSWVFMQSGMTDIMTERRPEWGMREKYGMLF